MADTDGEGTPDRASPSSADADGVALSSVGAVLGIALVGVSVFHHWLEASGAVLRGYFFISHNGLYTSRIVLLAPLAVGFALVVGDWRGRDRSELYRQLQARVLALTGLVSIGYPVWTWVLANQRSELITWQPTPAFYTTIAGGVVLYLSGGAILRRVTVPNADGGRDAAPDAERVAKR